jgi:hypothetical protein
MKASHTLRLPLSQQATLRPNTKIFQAAPLLKHLNKAIFQEHNACYLGNSPNEYLAAYYRSG